jgi:hypothetical protein
MRLSWLGTTAVALVIGSGAAIAQSQTEQKREEGPRPEQNQSKDTDRPPTADERARKDRSTQPDPKGGAKEQQRGEVPGDRKQQAQEPPRDTKQPSTQQSQDQQRGRDAKQPDSKQQQGQQGQPKDNQARDTKQPEPKQRSQPAQPKQDNQARDAKQPADTKQQQGQQQPSGQQRGQTAQPSTSTPQQTTPSATGQTGQQTTGRSSDPSRPAGTASTNVNDQQRSQIVDRLRRDRSVSRQNINIQVSIGERLPPRARLQRLPPDIVRIAPQYRGFAYTVVEDRVYVVEPRTRRVVDVIIESGPSTRTTSIFRSGGGERVVIAQEQRETFKQVARRGMTSAPTSASPGSLSDQSCLQLQAVPEELLRKNPELGQYRYLTIGEQILLVDPRQQKVVEVID